MTKLTPVLYSTLSYVTRSATDVRRLVVFDGIWKLKKPTPEASRDCASC